ncbi:MAG: NUMOD3 domain-containing DNA-binding protein [Glaciecola sp.]
MFYVYFHRKASDNSIFYVGKGKGRRAYWKNNRNKHWHNVVDKHGYTVEIYKDNLSEADAFNLEIEMIEKIGLDSLCNYTVGGDGASGSKRTEEFKSMMREKMTGRVFSNETIKKMREAAKNRTRDSHMKQAEKIRGRKLTEEHRRKISEAGKGRSLSEDAKRKISEFHKGKKKDPNAVEAMAASKRKKVRCLNNNTVYESMTAAANDLGIRQGKISDVLRGVGKSVKGYRFELVE